MKIDQYIAELQKIRANHGADLEVMATSVLDGTTKAGIPRVENMHARHRRLFRNGQDLDSDKGQKVVRV